MIAPFNPQLASNAAITGVAVKLLEQQQQHQFLAAALAINQNQLKQQQLQQQQQQQQQRTSPLQQSLMSFAGGMPANRNAQTRGIPPNVPVANQSHFRPIHPQPMVPTVSGETSNVFSLESLEKLSNCNRLVGRSVATSLQQQDMQRTWPIKEVCSSRLTTGRPLIIWPHRISFSECRTCLIYEVRRSALRIHFSKPLLTLIRH